MPNETELERDNRVLASWHPDPEVRAARARLLERRQALQQTRQETLGVQEMRELYALEDEADQLVEAVVELMAQLHLEGKIKT